MPLLHVYRLPEHWKELLLFSIQLGHHQQIHLFAAEVQAAENSDDLEKDGTTSDLGSGKHFTIYKFKFDESISRVILTISIHSGATTDNGGINDIVVVRKFREI